MVCPLPVLNVTSSFASVRYCLPILLPLMLLTNSANMVSLPDSLSFVLLITYNSTLLVSSYKSPGLQTKLMNSQSQDSSVDQQRLCQLWDDANEPSSKSQQLMELSLTTRELRLIDYLQVAPIEVFVYYFSPLAKQYPGTNPSLANLWDTLVSDAFYPEQPPTEQMTCPYQPLRDLMLSSALVVYKRGGLRLLQQVFQPLSDFPIEHADLFMMYYKFEQGKEEDHTKVLELLKEKGALKEKNYLPIVKQELRTAIQPLAYSYYTGDGETYSQQLGQLQSYVSGCSGLGFAVGNLLDQHRDEDLIRLFWDMLLKMQRAKTFGEYLLIVLQATVLYFKLVELQYDFPDCFLKIKPVMLLRLFPLILFDRNLESSPILVHNYFRLEATLHNLQHPQRLDFRKSAVDMMVAAVAIIMEKPIEQKAQIAVGNLATLIQNLLGDVDSAFFYMMRNWNIPQLPGIQALASQVGPQSYPNHHSSYINQLMTVLEQAIVEFRVEKAYLSLLAIMDYVQPMQVLEEVQASRLSTLIGRALVLCHRDAPLPHRYKPAVQGAINHLCFNLLEYTDSSADCTAYSNCYDIDLSATTAADQKTSQIVENMLVKARNKINVRRFVYPIDCTYRTWKMAEQNTGQVNIPNDELLTNTLTYNEPSFNLTRWVFWVYHHHSQDFKGLQRLLMSMASACSEESLACAIVPTIMLQMWVSSGSKQKQGTVDIGKLLTTVFERYIFENKMERPCKVGFLNLPAALESWNNNEDARALCDKVERLLGQLDLSRLAQAYAEIGLFKKAIRYLQQHIRWLIYTQESKVPILLYWRLYCYEVILEPSMHQISFEAIAPSLKANCTDSNPEDWLFHEDREMFESVNVMFMKWITKMVDTKGDFAQEQELLEQINIRVSVLCQAIAKAVDPCQKKSKCELLLMIRKIVKVAELCRCVFVEKSGKTVVGLPPNSGLLPENYQLLKNSLNHQKSLTTQLEDCLNDLVSLQLPDIFRANLLSNVLLLVRGKLKECFFERDAQAYRHVATGMEDTSFRFFTSRRILVQPLYQLSINGVSEFEENAIKNQIRWLHYENNHRMVCCLIKRHLLLDNSEQKITRGGKDLMEFLYYFHVSLAVLTLLQKQHQNVVGKTLLIALEYAHGGPLSDAAKHFCVQSAQYVCKLLNQIYQTQRTQLHLQNIMTLAERWIQLCRANKQAEVAEQLLFEATKIILKEMKTVTDDEAERFLIGNKVENYFENKEDLIKGIAVELLISNYAAREPVKRKFLEGLLTRVALKTPEECIWWVARLAHYCHNSLPTPENPREFAKLFDQTDIALERFGARLYKELEQHVDGNVYILLAYLYSAIGLHPLKGQEPKPPEPLQLTKEVRLPFVRQTLIKEVNAREVSPFSKWPIALFQTKCINQEGKLYDSKLLIKSAFSPRNLCVQAMANQLICELIPPKLDVTYTIVRLSKHVMMVQYLTDYKTVKDVIKAYRETGETEKKSESNEANKKAPAPVLHKLFDSLKDPEWWSRRVAYTRCTAIWSMVGHVLGLGDRHTGNIMVHQPTGNIVHIDYQMLLDDGKNQRPPQNVPFRMTPNIEAPMGALGAFGLFSLNSLQEMQRLQQHIIKIVNCTEMLAGRYKDYDVWRCVDFLHKKLHSNYSRYMYSEVLKLIKSSKSPVILENMPPRWNALE